MSVRPEDLKEGGQLNKYITKVGLIEKLYIPDTDYTDTVDALVNSITHVGVLEDFSHRPDPEWEEYSTELLSTECVTADGVNTGIAIKKYEVKYQDVNPESETFGQFKTEIRVHEEEDLDACPVVIHQYGQYLRFTNLTDSVNTVQLIANATTTGPKDLGLEYNIEKSHWQSAERFGGAGDASNYRFSVEPGKYADVRCAFSSESGKWSYGNTNFYTFVIDGFHVSGNPQSVIYNISPEAEYPDSVLDGALIKMFTAQNCTFDLDFTAKNFVDRSINNLVVSSDPSKIRLDIRFNNPVTVDNNAFVGILKSASEFDIHFLDELRISNNSPSLKIDAAPGSIGAFRVNGNVSVNNAPIDSSNFNVFRGCFNNSAETELVFNEDTKSRMAAAQAELPYEFASVFGENTYLG